MARLVRADDVVLDAFAGGVFHERHMLVSGGVEDDIRPIVVEQLINSARIADGANENGKVQAFMVFGKQFLLNVIGVVFIDVENNEMLGVMGRNLPAEFCTDGATAACDKNDLAGELVEDFVHVDFDGLAAEQVFDFDLLKSADGHFAAGELDEAWNAK